MPPVMKRKNAATGDAVPVSGPEQAVSDLDHKLFDILKEIENGNGQLLKKISEINNLEQEAKATQAKVMETVGKMEKELQDVMASQKVLKQQATAAEKQLKELERKLDLVDEQQGLKDSPPENSANDTVFLTNKLTAVQSDTSALLTAMHGMNAKHDEMV